MSEVPGSCANGLACLHGKISPKFPDKLQDLPHHLRFAAEIALQDLQSVPQVSDLEQAEDHHQRV
jgi:hypothetical protein